MKTHIAIIAWLHIIFNIPLVLLALGIMFGASAIGFLNLHALPIIGAWGAFVGLFILIFAIPGLVLGYGLLKLAPWGRVLGIVASIMDLLAWHTGGLVPVLGIYSLIILFNPETVALFERGY